MYSLASWNRNRLTLNVQVVQSDCRGQGPCKILVTTIDVSQTRVSGSRFTVNLICLPVTGTKPFPDCGEEYNLDSDVTVVAYDDNTRISTAISATNPSMKIPPF